mmetsp:Transcript_14904/g.35114  ORF Transcript_14904/g.35114 Transcript_14904/m.35114 type:complete len:468 (-) Transcript_14904:31-1434(-)
MASTGDSQTAYDGNSVLPTEVLVPLLFALRGAYSAPALQAELRRMRRSDVSHYHGTWRWDDTETSFVTIVKDGAGLRISGRLEDGRPWHGSLDRHGGTFRAVVKSRDGIMLAQIEVCFERTSKSEKTGNLRVTFLSLAGGNEVMGPFVATKAHGRGLFSGYHTSTWEQQEVLSRIQQPIFESFGLPGPPAGVWVLLRSVVAHGADSPEVTKVGNQCRKLLGQECDDGELDEDDVIAANAFWDGSELWASPSRWLPPAPAAESAVAVASSGLHGDGLVALHDFDIGQEIFQEEPLAVLHCGSSAHADARRAARRLIGSGQVDAVLRSFLWRGPPDGPKARELAEMVDILLEGGWHEHRDNLLEALQVFGFNAFSTRDDSAQVLYALICKANHSCTPNAAVVVPNSGSGQLVCIRPVARDEEITVSYLNAKELYMEPHERVLRLRRGWEFVCACPSCASGRPERREGCA